MVIDANKKWLGVNIEPRVALDVAGSVKITGADPYGQEFSLQVNHSAFVVNGEHRKVGINVIPTADTDPTLNVIGNASIFGDFTAKPMTSLFKVEHVLGQVNISSDFV